MRWFLDTEFDENGKTIELISIALVSEAGKEYYAVSKEFNPAACNDWVKDHVLPKLPKKPWSSRADIAADVKALLLADGDKPEIWGYFSDYDWVALCQLFGRMIDLPQGFPMWCRDLKQQMSERGIEKASLPPEDPTREHDALADARWIRDAWLHMNEEIGT